MPRTLMFTGCVNRPLSYAKTVSGKGIASFFLDEASGTAEAGPVFTDIVNPTFIALSPDGSRLAAISETEDEAEDSISLFAVNATTGGLVLLGRQSTRGTVACHCAFDATGTLIGAANYGRKAGDAISIHRIVGNRPGEALTSITHSGKGPNAQRQERSHAHCVRWTPDNRYIAVVDLGIDKVLVYRADDFSLASEVALAPGCGPRHIVFHPTKPFAYVMAELQPGVTTLAYADGRLAALATEPVQPPVSGGSGIVMAPDCTHLFVGDRGNAAVARFTIGEDSIARYASSTLSGGDIPRDLAFTPSGTVLAIANVLGDAVTLFRHAADGALAPLAKVATGTPTSVAFLEARTA